MDGDDDAPGDIFQGYDPKNISSVWAIQEDNDMDLKKQAEN